jgi:uncharacterized protein with von Willebrand factor type A (vWA) domain
MPPRRKRFKPRPRPAPPLPAETCWIENDAYDRAVFARLRAESPSLRALEEGGGVLLPHFGPLLQDLFCLFFKYNVIFLDQTRVRPSAMFNRTLLASLQAGQLYTILRELTLLDEPRAGLCTLLAGEAILEFLKSEKVMTRRDLIDLWDLEKQEELIEQKWEELRNAAELAESDLPDPAKRAVNTALERLDGQLDGAAASLRQKARRFAEALGEREKQVAMRVQAQAIKIAQNLEQAMDEAERWGVALGTGHRSPAGRKLELGKRLAGNEKLKKLSRLVGRMKQEALALRKKVFERSSQEVLEVERGDALARLLPSELSILPHPLLRKDFARRLLDKELLEYSLRGIDDKGKGPMIVCLDGSSSMAGDKELWSKAVTLTLLEIARRQRRLFRSICFASAETPLQVLDLNPREHYEVSAEKALDLAEYFPGGGTDFEKPLDAALECLRTSRFKKGDIVFITDGECQVSPAWAERFREEKERLGFSLFSILIDVGPSSLGTLKEFSDKITTVRQLTGEEAKEIFVQF